MSTNASTCWSVIAGAATGNRDDRERFALLYGPLIRAYLAARWRTSPCRADLDDAVQEVFVAFFKSDGALEPRPAGFAAGFRPFLYGVVRNVARHVETRQGRDRLRGSSDHELDQVPDDEESLSRLFDRTWALSLVREAAELQADRARRSGPAALSRVELLRLRFHEGLPIRQIAELWQEDAAKLHHEYARAREEFKVALLEVVAFHHPGPPEEIERECANLTAHLG